ncbi:DUF1129 family protein [Virgibacillus sp. YIM 98842]|uniref:DUF1129 family protein n=1 Tax=Virgibacillus sp. YIM 98842 TaxID=2663533 RepID=UPI0013DD5395|nr:DUF1129 family protein [Virgibacillus sp. YIM 98842]
MDAKELIQLNNVKRKQLEKQNLKFYEDMLVYIRLSYDKSEQETEEILSELLDHLLEAQLEGRMANDVFGDNPKQYADQIIGELPKMVTKERMKLFSMAILYFFASVSIFSALFTIIDYFIFNLHSLSQEILLGSLLIKTVLSIPIAFLFLYAIIQYFRWSCFREINKAAEFLVYWLFGMIVIGVFVLLIFIIPDIGPVMEVPVYITALLGLILYFAARMTRKSI